jgi:hypothetical protein
MRPETALLLEERYRGIGLRLPAAHGSTAGVLVPGTGSQSGGGERNMPGIIAPAAALGDGGAATPAAGQNGTAEAPETQPAENGVVGTCTTMTVLTGQDADRIIALNARLTELGAPELDIEARLAWLAERVVAAQEHARILGVIRGQLRAVGVEDGVDIVEAVRMVAAQVPDLTSRNVELMAQVEGLNARVAETATLAEDGRTYRADLIAEAMAEGVRAYGPTFAQDTYRGILEAGPIATIRRLRDDWRTIGDKLFQPGRQTVETSEPPKPAAATSKIDDAAYRGA